MPQRVAVLGLEAHRGRQARHAVVVTTPLSQVAVRGRLAEPPRRQAHRAVWGVHPVLLQDADRTRRGQVAALAVQRAQLHGRDRLAPALQRGHGRDLGPAPVGAVQRLGPPPFATPGTGGSQARLGALAGQGAFELGQRREQVEGELAVDGGGGGALGQAVQLDAAVLQLPGQRDQVRHGASQPVQAPDHELVASARHLQRERQARPRHPRPAGPVLVDAAAAGPLQHVALQVEVLVLGAHARVADHHGRHRGRKAVQAVGSDT